MPRLQPIAPANATDKTSQLYDQVKRALGKVPNMMQTLGHSPAALEGYLSLSQSLGHGVLSAQDRERVALASAQQNDCGYCLAAHSMLGKMVGLSAEEVVEARKGESDDPQADALLRFTQSILRSQGHVEDAELAKFREAGYDDAAVAEVVAHVALNVLTNYFNSVAETEVDFPQVDAVPA
ncbi:carboxymuconolactone decarboxylase family protein [Bremerella cremea]|uniref:carboxymuconolactone decarboxylase family protein n=1 Tax=Bremerella cremea TaxID=1031537 RepID=UPI0031EBC9D2